MLLWLFFGLQLSLIDARPRCRCIAPDSPCWPNDAAWSTLREAVNDRLLYPKPTASVCSRDTYNATACAIVKNQWSNAFWRSDQSGAMQNANWENSSCSIEVNRTNCNQGSVAIVAVDAIWPEHVQETIRFAARYDLRLVVKSTGHDYLGRSTAAGSLLLWLHHMKNISLIPQYFTCDKQSIMNAVRIGAGMQWGEVYEWLDKYNLTAIGGAAGSVGAIGGYLQGGGHGPLSHWKGLAADQVLEFDVVMANGRRETVHACQNSELFWALRGGGGGTYAVVLSAVLQTFPTPSMAVGAFNMVAPNPTRYTRLIEDFVRLLVAGADAGWSSYFFMIDQSINGEIHIPNGNLTALAITMYEFADKNSDIYFDPPAFLSTESFYDYYLKVLKSNNPTGGNVLLGSRLIPESILRDSPSTVAQVFSQVKGDSATGSTFAGHLVAGGAVSTMAKVNNSVNPGWRTALLHMICVQGWLDTTSESDKTYIIERLTRHTQLLGTLSGDDQSTCYTNEADPNEPDWQEKFYGSKTLYNKLKSIKQMVDPDGLFVCKNCVGSDDWTDDLNCLKTSGAFHTSITLFLLALTLIFVF